MVFFLKELFDFETGRYVGFRKRRFPEIAEQRNRCGDSKIFGGVQISVVSVIWDFKNRNFRNTWLLRLRTLKKMD